MPFMLSAILTVAVAVAVVSIAVVVYYIGIALPHTATFEATAVATVLSFCTVFIIYAIKLK